MESSICEIEKLVEIFSLGKQNEDEEAEDTEKGEIIVAETSCDNKTKQGNAAAKNTKKINPYAKLDTETKNKEIFDPEEYFSQQDDGEFASKKNWKKTPIWEIIYKQKVSAEDVFLGMGLRNPSTASCENMVITVNLPGENRQNIELKIEEKSLTLESSKFYLNMNLPHPVDSKKGSAEFDKESEKLVITLCLNREFDVLNF